MYVYNNQTYANRNDAQRALEADERHQRNELKKSKCIFVANLVLTAVIPLMLLSDHLGWSPLTPQTKFLGVLALGYFLWQDQQMAERLFFREAKINNLFQRARAALAR